MLLGGDADYVVELFLDLVACFQEAGYLDSRDREAVITEFKCLVVDLRQQRLDSSQFARIFDIWRVVEVIRVKPREADSSSGASHYLYVLVLCMLVKFPLVRQVCRRVLSVFVWVQYNRSCSILNLWKVIC